MMTRFLWALWLMLFALTALTVPVMFIAGVWYPGWPYWSQAVLTWIIVAISVIGSGAFAAEMTREKD